MNTPFSLANRTVLVTGASSGIGRQIAIDFALAGANLVVTGRNEARLQETLLQLKGSGHRCLAFDLNDAKAVEDAIDTFPVFDGVVLAAGILKIAPMKIVSKQDLADTMQTNFLSPVHLVQGLLSGGKIKKGGSVVFISSVNGIFTNTKGFGAYAGSKAAMNSMTKTLALEYAGRRIRFNAINPGMIKTEMFLGLSGVVSEQDILEDKKKYPLGDYGEPSDVSNACIFLVSDASKWITGSSLVVDGGLTIA